METIKKQTDTEEISVGRTTNPSKLSEAIVHKIEQGKTVTVLTVGDRALNQGVKGLCIARGSLASKGINLAWYSGFETVNGRMAGEKITAIRTYLFRAGL